MRKRAPDLIRGVGLLNVLYTAAGMYFVVDGTLRYFVRGSVSHRLPYEPILYCVFTVINLVLLVLLFLAGLWLLRLDRRGVVLGNAVLVAEVIYFIGQAWLGLGLTLSGRPMARAIGRAMAAVAGVGNMGTAIQLLTGYPVIGLVVMNLARRHLDRNSGWRLRTPANP